MWNWTGKQLEFAGYTASIGGSSRQWVAEVRRDGAVEMHACGIVSEAKARRCVEAFLEKSDDQERARYCATTRTLDSLEAALRTRVEQHTNNNAIEQAAEATAIVAIVAERRVAADAMEAMRLNSRRASGKAGAQ